MEIDYETTFGLEPGQWHFFLSTAEGFFLEAFAGNPRFGVEKFSKASFAEFWEGVFDSQAGGVILARANGRYIGILGFVVTPDQMTGVLVGTELFLYVSRDSRDSGVAEGLMAEFKAHATRLGAGWLQGSECRDSGPEVAAMFEGFGYRRNGAVFVGEV